MNKWMYTAVLLLLAAFVATGCGGGNKDNDKAAPSPAASEAAAGDVKAITINAKNFEFDQQEIKVKKGDTISITLKNTQGLHSIKINGYDQVIKPNKAVTFTADKAGTFEFICDTMCGGGHAEMTGKLIVE
ncbi:MAG: cupredoxin domain-containing protein [Cohnella sp.]|nr:cupredoxin domain-containing protein [Cohnella sp.]